MKHIEYAIDRTSGMVISRVDSEIAVPVLQFDRMSPQNNFLPVYMLERMSVFHLAATLLWDNYQWTKKIPVEIKNRHRKFWGMKELEAK